MDIWVCEDEKFAIFLSPDYILERDFWNKVFFYDCPSPCKEVQNEGGKNEIASKEMSTRKWTFKHEGNEC